MQLSFGEHVTNYLQTLQKQAEDTLKKLIRYRVKLLKNLRK